MPGFFKANLSIAQAQALLVHFTLITVEAMLHPGNTTRRLNMLRAVILHVSQPMKKITFTKTTKSYQQGGRKLELEKYHRFLVLGVPGTSTVIALFSANSQESRTLFRYSESLKPGAVATFIKPNLEGQLARGGTPLISTREPIIPTTAAVNPITLPPYDVEGSSLEFNYFHLLQGNSRSTLPSSQTTLVQVNCKTAKRTTNCAVA